MADDEQFSLCWNNFNSNLSAGFHESLCRGDLVDVTLAAEGQFVKAHRLVLSVCSPYFRKMFTQMPANQHAFVFLKDVSHTALKDLIQFMYCGEVNVKQEALPAFISTAEALQIKGLTDSDPPASQSPPQQPQTAPQIRQISPPRARQRTTTARSTYKVETLDDSVDDKQATQIVIQTTAAPQTTTTLATQIPQTQIVTQQAQIVSTATTPAVTTVVSHKRPARSSGISNAKRTKGTVDSLDSSTSNAQQITVVSAPKQQSQQRQEQQAETEYIDLPIELPPKSEPDYAEEGGDVAGDDQDATYVEDDSYGDMRYDESYFTEGEDGNANATGASVASGGGSGGATTSKAVVKQSGSFSDATYVESGDQGNSDAQASKFKATTTALKPLSAIKKEPGSTPAPTAVVRRRGRPKRQDDHPPASNATFLERIITAINNHAGVPAIYASTTKGGMKLVYEGHHFRYSFRKGQYSIFQCCFKESKNECKVKIVTDQKLAYPLEGEHCHYMPATDKSVTCVQFEPGSLLPEPMEQEHREQEPHILYEVEEDEGPFNAEEHKRPIEERHHEKESGQGSKDDQHTEESEVAREVDSNGEEQDAGKGEAKATETPAIDDQFREKIRKRLQRALMGKKK